MALLSDARLPYPSRLMHRSSTLSIILVVALTACGSPAPIGVTEPGSGSGGSDAGLRTRAATCNDGARGQSRPLVVDWASSDRAELEARAAKGVAVVKWEGCEMSVLRKCAVKGGRAYGYTGVTPKTDRVTMRDQTEVHANIPVYAARFEGKLAASGELNVAMTIVGQWGDDKPTPARNELAGECAGATHVVSALTVGSFEFFAGKSTEVSGEAGVLGVGAGAKKASSREVLNRDGDDKRCEAANGDDKKPPFGCGALLRLEVVPVGEPRREEPTCPSGTAWDGGQCLAVKKDTTCPEGQIPDKVRGCVAKKVAAVPPPGARVLTATGSEKGVAPVRADCVDVAECKASCDKGEAKGCLGLGGRLRAGLKPGGKDPQGEEAATAFKKACDGGEPSACVAVGEMMYQGLGIARDGQGSLPLFEKACEAGEASGCNDMGIVLGDPSVGKDPARAAKFYARACTGTSALGCLGLGMLTRDGRGVPRDPARAKQLFQKACDAKIQIACKLAQ